MSQTKVGLRMALEKMLLGGMIAWAVIGLVGGSAIAG